MLFLRNDVGEYTITRVSDSKVRVEAHGEGAVEVLTDGAEMLTGGAGKYAAEGNVVVMDDYVVADWLHFEVLNYLPERRKSFEEMD